MNIIKKIRQGVVLRILRSTNPERLHRIGLNKLLSVFKQAAENIPAYKRMLEKGHIHVKKIHDLSQFKSNVPVIDKSIFTNNDILNICNRARMPDIMQAATSSGFSGDFSFGLTLKGDRKKTVFFVDTLMEYIFNVSRKRTLWINTTGMGVRIPTSIPLVETSVRPEVVLDAVRRLAHHFDQIILHGNPFFIKKVLEDGIEQGIDWRSMKVNIITGEDWFPETFRNYMMDLAGINNDAPGGGQMLTTFGICEVALTLFQESPDLVRIRRLAMKDKNLREELFGKGSELCPILFHYHPYQIYLEEKDGELLFTSLTQNSVIPLIRYDSKDKGKVYSYNQVKNILKMYGYEAYIPDLKLPLVSVMGRSGKSLEVNGKEVTPELIKACIYDTFELAGATTGYFRMSKKEGSILIEIQLREKYTSTEDLLNKYNKSFHKYLGDMDIGLKLYPYRDFPYGIGLMYEKRFSYIS